MATQVALPNSQRSVSSHHPVEELNRHIRAWCVVHACSRAHDVTQLVDGQRAVGMRPYLLAGMASSPELRLVGSPPALPPHAHSGSLLTAWNEVREWRKLLMAPDVSAFELIHAHVFPAGMAAVRNCPAVVYDIRSFIESRANARPGNEFTWLARSFRVAEQFVLARAGAVVVHSHAMREGALERGALPENLFQIPDPLDADWTELLRQRRVYARQGANAEDVTFFAPDVCLREEDGDALTADAVHLLEAFAMTSREVAGARLFIQADSICIQPLFEKASALGVAANVHAIGSGDRERAIAEADVIIAVSSEQAEITVLTGLLKGRAVLAADVPPTRDASSDGRGVLWFHHGDVRDLASRAAFLARNPDFRVALAEAGRKHLLESRTSEVVARRYDSLYRHAWERRRSGASPGGMYLQPLTACF